MPNNGRCDICDSFHNNNYLLCCGCSLCCCMYCINNDNLIKFFNSTYTRKCKGWTCSRKCVIDTLIKIRNPTEIFGLSLYVQSEIVKMNYIIKYVKGDIRQTKKYLMNYICKDVINIIIEYSHVTPTQYILNKETTDILSTITPF